MIPIVLYIYIYIHIHVCVCPPGSPLRTSPSFVDPVESPSRFDYLHDYCCVIHIIYTHVCMYVCMYVYIYIYNTLSTSEQIGIVYLAYRYIIIACYDRRQYNCLCIRNDAVLMYIYIYTYIYVCVYIYIYMYTRTLNNTKITVIILIITIVTHNL